MIPRLRNDWAPMAAIPATPMPVSPPVRGRTQRHTGALSRKSSGSEDEKHRQCSLALGSLCHGGTVAEAAAVSGLDPQRVAEIHRRYAITRIITNDSHQVDDGVQIGPWAPSRLYQSGRQRFKNDFHSWNYLWVMGLSVDQAMNALETWPEFVAIRVRLTRDYPMTWRQFARLDITRCYAKFIAFKGPEPVSRRTQAKVEAAVAALGKLSFKAGELMPLLKLSKRHVQRALSRMPKLRKGGAKRGSRWEVVSTVVCQGPAAEDSPVPFPSPTLQAERCPEPIPGQPSSQHATEVAAPMTSHGETRLSSPASAVFAGGAVLDRIPLGGAGGVEADRWDQTRSANELLMERAFPKPGSGPVAAATADHDQQLGASP